MAKIIALVAENVLATSLGSLDCFEEGMYMNIYCLFTIICLSKWPFSISCLVVNNKLQLMSSLFGFVLVVY